MAHDQAFADGWDAEKVIQVIKVIQKLDSGVLELGPSNFELDRRDLEDICEAEGNVSLNQGMEN